MVTKLWQKRCNCTPSQVVWRMIFFSFWWCQSTKRFDGIYLWILFVIFSNVVAATDLTMMALAGIGLRCNKVF